MFTIFQILNPKSKNIIYRNDRKDCPASVPNILAKQRKLFRDIIYFLFQKLKLYVFLFWYQDSEQFGHFRFLYSSISYLLLSKNTFLTYLIQGYDQQVSTIFATTVYKISNSGGMSTDNLLYKYCLSGQLSTALTCSNTNFFQSFSTYLAILKNLVQSFYVLLVQ